MPQAGNQHGQNQHSIKYRFDPVDGTIFELSKFVQEESASNLTLDHKNVSCGISQPKSLKLLTTPELISAVGHVLDYTSRSLSFLGLKDNFNSKDSCWKKDIIVDTLKSENGFSTSFFARNGCHQPSTPYGFSPMVQPNFDCLKVLYGVSLIKAGNESYTQKLFGSFLARNTSVPIQPWKGKGLSGLGNIHGWMFKLVPSGEICPSNTEVAEGRNVNKYFSGIRDSHCGVSAECTHKSSVGCDNDLSFPSLAESRDLAAATNVESDISVYIGSLHSDYNLRNGKSLEADTDASTTCSSRLLQDYRVNALSFRGKAYDCGSWSNENNNEMFECKEYKGGNPIAGETSNIKIHLLERAKANTSLAKQEHAFAGAFAGIFVSLCLHPVDTIKTIIQSCRAEERSLCYIGRSIISERGLTGLYRGISSNVASSAPISAIYTFTYESVKSALLPLFPREFYSVAHCLAGGCASIATSFIFTPSEHIKQQLQVGSHYQNCWQALVGIMRTGGLPSLYAGWGAVLCRNIPHSVIKFYMYENLKHWMLSSVQCAGSGQPSTLQTLVCGGIAGSTAALFTTPFDVVKTRLQTQKPGSVCKYDGVFHALQEISSQEGLRGLYRGLTPRLLMYITQGALFFASYEFFKRLFNLNEPRFSSIPKVQYEKRKKDELGPQDFPLSSPSSPASAASS
ncbi:hypothetical protein SAY87_024800 [Trapa incisa]|uniref:Mitochondrial substrate carrier family protein n=1 Tax=Trapa incisa TaxID=236973 RepID=A0AAN7GLF1_9MYRT|nr:hypothetical protein SAY87_024800 [Trapa incisa]